MTSESVLESRKQGKTLLAESGKVTANPTEDLCSVVSPELTGNLLLSFNHAQITLSEVVIKRYGEIMEKVIFVEIRGSGTILVSSVCKYCKERNAPFLLVIQR